MNKMMERVTTFESLTDLSSIVPAIPGMIYTYAVNHETGKSSFPYVSDYCEELFGLPAKEIQRDPEAFVNMVHPDDVAAFTESVLESMSKLTTWELKMKMVTKSGEVKRVHGKSSPFRTRVINANGSTTQLTVWYGTLLDISFEKREYEVAFQHHVDHPPPNVQPCFGIDKDGIIRDWNDPISKLTGLKRSEVLNMPFDFLLPESSKDADLSSFSFPDHTTSSSNQRYSKHLELRTKNENEIKHVYATFRKRVAPNGLISGVFCTCKDITAQKKLEEEKLVAQELLESERNLTEWLSHEIRNPLSIAMEASFALKDSHSHCATDEDGISYVDLISQCITYVVDLLTNILDLNKCLEGKIVLRPKICMVREDIIKPIVQMMSLPNSRTSGGNVPIHLYCDDDFKIFVDKLRLKQVITNLLSNAIKFTKEGFIRVSLQKVNQRRDSNGIVISESIKITVSDSGPGISPDNYDKIFKKWEQFSPTTSGAGIGLCISKLLVNALGGTIDLNKKYNSGIEGRPGAEFVVILPINNVLAQDYAGNAMHSVPAFSALSAAVMSSSGCLKGPVDLKHRLGMQASNTSIANSVCILGKYRLLIVDDDKMNRKIFRRRFSKLFPQASIDEADSGETAIELTQHQRYDVIFIDQFMGKMNGDEAIRIMRDSGVDSLVAGISANAKSQSHISAGAETFFQKPIPRDGVFVQRLLPLLPPPSGWKVLILDDVKLNIHFLRRKLCKVASAHFIRLDIAEKHWSITDCMTSKEAIDAFCNEWYDLIILDNNLGDESMKGVEVATIARKSALNANAVIVINSGSDARSRESLDLSKKPLPFDIFWPKPLPSVDQMRQSLCQALLRSK